MITLRRTLATPTRRAIAMVGVVGVGLVGLVESNAPAGGCQ